MRFPSFRAWPALLLSLGAAVTSACGDGESVVRPTPGGDGGAGGAPGSDDGGEPTTPPGPVAGAAGAGEAGAPAGSGACGELDEAALGAASWDPRFTIAGVTGHDGITPTVYDFAVEPSGTVLATGRFAYHQGRAVPPLLRLRDGEWEPAHAAWTIEPPGDGFAALAVREDGVVALATADSFGERDGELWLDRGDVQQVLARFTGQVRTLAWFRGELYVAGAFRLADELGGVENLAVWDGESWKAPRGGEADGPVLELLVSGDALYVGGAFSAVGGIESANVAVFDGESWSARPLTDALAVYALARSDEGELYAGGALGALDAPSGVVKLVGDEWQVVGGGVSQLGTRGVVSDLSVHDGVLDVSGCFNVAGGSEDSDGAVKAEGLARWDGTTWASLNTSSGTNSPWFQPGACGDEGLALWDMEYQRLGFHDGKLFAGGSFAGVEGVQSQSLSVYEDGEWRAQGKGGLGVGGSLDRVVVGGPGCELFGLGGFTHLGGKAEPGRVARFDGSAWHLLRDELPRDAYCPAIDVSRDGELTVACMVFSDDGGAKGVLLVRDGERLVPRELAEELPPLHALRWDRTGRLWLAGGDARGFVATLTGDELRFVSREFDAPVQFLDVTNADDVLAAGTFLSVGDVEAKRIARYQGGEWRALGDGLVGQPQAIARDADHVYASTYDEGQGAMLLGAFDGERWSERAGGKSGLAVEDFYSFNQILPVPSGLILVGTAQLQSGEGRGALVWEDGKLRPLGGGGVHGILVGGVAVAPRSVWVGGVIAEVSDGTETISSVGVARLAW